MAAREHPDLIILDLIMPDVSGFNVAYSSNRIPATRGIPISSHVEDIAKKPRSAWGRMSRVS